MTMYRVAYGFLVSFVLVATFATWITLLIKRDDTVNSCNQYMASRGTSMTTESIFGEDDEDCSSKVHALLAVGAIICFIGNAAQVREPTLLTPSTAKVNAALLCCCHYGA